MAQRKSTPRHQSSEPKGKGLTAFVRRKQSKSSLAQADVATLFAVNETATDDDMEQLSNLAVTVLIEMIEVDPEQPRDFEDDYEESEEHQELLATVRRYGVLQPILLRPIKHKADGTPRAYRLVAGERRLRAAIAAGLKSVPAILGDYNDQQILEIQIIENGARRGLSDIEAARAYRRLADEFGYTQEEIAKRTGKSQGEISRLLKIFGDPILAQYVERGDITTSQAREIVATKDATAKAQIARELASANKNKKSVPLASLRTAVQTGQASKLHETPANTDRTANNGIAVSRSGAPSHTPSRTPSHQPSKRSEPTPSERAAQLLDDMRHGVSVWSGVATQVEENPNGVAPDLARDINAEIANMEGQIARLRAIVPATGKVRLVG